MLNTKIKCCEFEKTGLIRDTSAMLMYTLKAIMHIIMTCSRLGQSLICHKLSSGIVQY